MNAVTDGNVSVSEAGGSQAQGSARNAQAGWRAPLAAPRILIVPGLHDSGPAHWQSRWQQRWRHLWRQCGPARLVERVVQQDWDTPDLAAWSARVSAALAQSEAPTVIVAHSFGCLATLHAKAPPQLLGALLVAPANPARFGLDAELARARPRYPSRVIASRDDPWMAFEDAAHWAQRWGSTLVDAGARGHLNADSGLGDWPFGLRQLGRLLASIAARQDAQGYALPQRDGRGSALRRQASA